MKKINMKRFVFVGTFVIFFYGCNNFAENKIASPLLTGKTITQGDGQNNVVNEMSEIQISLSQIDFQVGINEPVFLSLNIQNGTENVVNIDLGQDYKGGFLFTVVSPDGKEIEIPRFKKDGMSLRGNVSIQSKQIYTRKLIFNEWFDFESPGEYVIKGRLLNPIKIGEKEVKNVKSDFNIVLDVKPRSFEKLERTSEILYRQVLETSDFEQKAVIALALGYVNDPVAVPYLERLLIADKMVDSIVINGLARIGDKTAVEVLNKTIKQNPNSEVSLLSKQALRRIENRNSGANK